MKFFSAWINPVLFIYFDMHILTHRNEKVWQRCKCVELLNNFLLTLLTIWVVKSELRPWLSLVFFVEVLFIQGNEKYITVRKSAFSLLPWRSPVRFKSSAQESAEGSFSCTCVFKVPVLFCTVIDGCPPPCDSEMGHRCQHGALLLG